jgi:hypothetical protein
MITNAGNEGHWNRRTRRPALRGTAYQGVRGCTFASDFQADLRFDECREVDNVPQLERGET